MSMNQASSFAEKRLFYPVSEYYKEKFGEKVFKIPVAIAGKCPNLKDGSGNKTCIFCDEWGSFAYPENQEKTLRQQIELHRTRVAERYNTKKFFVYFQAYTTTYTQVQKVKRAFEIALEYDGVVGIVIGTRPDCLSPALLDIFNAFSQKTFLGVELGVQSFDEKQLLWMRRGHTAIQSKKAIQRLKETCPAVNVGIHLMFGWPNESDSDIIETARICNQLGVDNVKLHNLHVLRNTVLEEIFNRGEFVPIGLETYANRVCLFLSHLSPDISVHRLVATASRWDELISPAWTRNKMQTYQYMLDFLKSQDFYQGKNYEAV